MPPRAQARGFVEDADFLPAPTGGRFGVQNT
jgi:hypothetical protein